VARNGNDNDASRDNEVNENHADLNADNVTDQEEISNVGHNGESFTVNNDGIDSSFDWNNLPLTEIKKDHYLADSEFGDMYQYLSASVLTGDDKKDRMILLLSDQFYLRDNLL